MTKFRPVFCGLLLVLCLSSLVFGQGASYPGLPLALARGGLPLSGATVTVCSGNVATNVLSSPPCSPYASIYSDPALVVPITQPGFKTDGLGNYPFFVAASSTYTICLTGSSFVGSCTVWNSPTVAGGAFTLSAVNNIQLADTSVCTAANDTCFTNALAALPSTGGMIYACGSYSFTTSVTISKPVIIQGCGGPSVTTGGTQVGAKISPASGTPLQMFNVTGAGTSNMLSGVTFRDVNFQGNYNAGQAAIRFNEVLNVITQNVSFGNWQQATDFDYFFRWSSINDTWTLCGAGNANTTACNRIENRTNPGVPDEQVNFINPLMEGDQSTFTKNGIGWYFGSLVNQITFTGLVKCDYFNSGTTAPCMQFVDSNKIYISGIDASFGGAHPSTATATILVTGSGGNPTTDFHVSDGQMGFGASTYAIKYDYSQNTYTTGINFQGPGSAASAVGYTANASGTQTNAGNALSSADAFYSDSSANGVAGCNISLTALGTLGCGPSQYVAGGYPRLLVNNGDRINIFSNIQAIRPAPQAPTTYPLGNDVGLRPAGPADIHIANEALDVVSSTSVGAPGSVTVTVGSPTVFGVATGGNPTALFASAATLIIDPNGANEEYVGSFTIASSSTLTITFAKTHTQPFHIRQQGIFRIDGFALLPAPDPNGQWTDLRVGDTDGNVAFKLNAVHLATWPQVAPKFSSTWTGDNGTNHDILFRHNNAASIFRLLSAGGSSLFTIDNSGNATFAGGNASINSAGLVTATGISFGGSPSSGHASCWKTATTQSYCESVVAADGTCTCH